jgi:hypothetical protein
VTESQHAHEQPITDYLPPARSRRQSRMVWGTFAAFLAAVIALSFAWQAKNKADHLAHSRANDNAANHQAVDQLAQQVRQLGGTPVVQPSQLPGPTGAQGIPGPVGPTGPAGVNGLNGSNGAAGRNGANGQNGAAGPAGMPGPIGPAGPSGSPGATGPTGPVGPTGPAGSTGPTGPACPAGYTQTTQTPPPPNTTGETWVICTSPGPTP